MLTDPFGNPVYQVQDLINLIYTTTSIREDVFVEDTEEISQFEHLSNLHLKKLPQSIYTISTTEFDAACQSDWFIPEDYINLDIKDYIISVCPLENLQRAEIELDAFERRNLFPVLRTLKYLVDTFRKHNVFWGVGRGSSVSSYVLYLLGVHKIDSVKYNLDWQDFLR